MPRTLSDADVALFRERLCEVAEKLFAEQGPEAVTMRQLAAALGVSPMTPYRYFKDKDDILAAVRAQSFNRFAQALEDAYARPGDARTKGAAVGEAYVRFAFDHPQTYKLMFDMHQPDEQAYPELKQAAERARATMSQYVRGLVESGRLQGDPVRVGEMFWASTHGCIVLEMAGRLPPGGALKLMGEVNSAIARGLRHGR
ncbi:MAG TPA: TetR/AcrR family transcriptional regulator [Phenylobacterium sp.]|nr:TetR/AcrR family transcriptional regulator [Phenylobacterium sp.]HMP62223.1 TetR/AcrR family transcriptional regulator [Phenylobacterium sp.]